MISPLRLGAALLALSSCLASDVTSSGDEAATVEQQLGTAWLLELENAPAGFVSSVSSATGGSVCSTKSLRLSLGVNMSKPSREWLNARLAQKPGALSGAIYLATTNQRLAFSKADVVGIDFPVARVGDANQSFFTITLSSTTPSTCSAVTVSVMAQKNQQAAAFAARPAFPKDTIIMLGTRKATPTPETITSIKPTEARLTMGIGMGQGLYEWIKEAFDHPDEPRSGAFLDAGLYELPLDTQARPIVVIGYGPLVTATVTNDAGTLVFAGARIGVLSPDGGIE